MTVTIFNPNSIVGKQLIIYSLAKGWNVKAFGGNVESLIDREKHTPNFKAIKGHVLDPGEVKFGLTGSDVVLANLGGALTGTDKSRSLGAKNIVAKMKELGIRRIVAVGGRGILPDEKGRYLMDASNYPPEYLAVMEEHKAAYLHLKNSGLDWTFVCASQANLIDARADNQFVTVAEAAPDGLEISSGNLALFMVSELELNRYLQKRVGICNTVN